MDDAVKTCTETEALIAAFSESLSVALIEEFKKPVEYPGTGSPLHELGKIVQKLVTAHIDLISENEAQTVGEGAFELKRRAQMRNIASRFDSTVGEEIEKLISRGNEVSQASEQAVQAVDNVAASAKEIRETIATVKDRAGASGETVALATVKAEEAIEMTENLKSAAGEIVKVVDLIEAIAMQTSLLALNASVEAARAGAVGKGFGVVASEVKNLSVKTTEAAQSVRKTVLGMNEATRTMTLAVDAIKEANGNVSTTTSGMIEAIESQVEATDQITSLADVSARQMSVAEERVRAIQTEAGALKSKTGQFVRFVSAEPGVTATEVRFGQSAPFSGAVASLGLGTRKGIELAFAEAAAAGGIHGRKPVLVAHDDGYDPKRALENVRNLVRSGEILGLVGAVGTPTSKLSERIARGGQVPFIGAVTGTAFLRSEDRKNVVNLRASYDDEAKALVGHFAASGKDLSQCGFFYQSDAYGFSVRDSLQKALGSKGGALTVLAPYSRETGDVSAAVATIAREKPKVVFMAGTAAPTAKLLAGVRAAGVEAEFATISFVGAAELARQAGQDGAGVLVSQVVPMPDDANHMLSRSYLKALSAHLPREKPDFAMLEGYLTGRMICDLLQRIGPSVSRERLLSAVFNRRTEMDVSGFRLAYGPGNNAGSDAVFLTRMRADGSYEAVRAEMRLRNAS